MLASLSIVNVRVLMMISPPADEPESKVEDDISAVFLISMESAMMETVPALPPAIVLALIPARFSFPSSSRDETVIWIFPPSPWPLDETDICALSAISIIPGCNNYVARVTGATGVCSDNGSVAPPIQEHRGSREFDIPAGASIQRESVDRTLHRSQSAFAPTILNPQAINRARCAGFDVAEAIHDDVVCSDSDSTALRT